MSTLLFDVPVCREENAVSALNRLEENCIHMAYFRRIGTSASVWPAWFFVLKLIHELHHLRAAEKDPQRRKMLDFSHNTACMLRAELRKVRSSPDCYTPETEEHLSSIEGLLFFARRHMESLIEEYPGVIKPDSSYHIKSIELA